MIYEQVKDLDSSKFRRATGLKQTTFNFMVHLLTQADKLKKAKAGRKSKLSIEDRVLMTLAYWREYRPYFHLGHSYGLSESGCYKIVLFVEDTLIKAPEFCLEGKKVLMDGEALLESIVIDTTETPIQRPKKQRTCYSGKKKRHTLKSQVVVDQGSKRILCTDFAHGKVHDIELLKRSKLSIGSKIQGLVDLGYQGIRKIYRNCLIGVKKKKGMVLSASDKKLNRWISAKRIVVEHVIRCVKRFKIVSEVYRNRGKRFGLRLNLLAGIYNLELNS